jgi:glycosyltransferase involved in cell wall biosynthesis
MVRTIVHYTEAPVFGGAERMLLTLLAGLDQDRWRSLLFYHEYPGVAQLVKEAAALGVPTAGFRPWGKKRGVVVLPRLVRAIRESGAEIFHAHPGWALRCTKGLVAASIARTRAVVVTQQLFAAPEARRGRLQHRLVSRLVDRYIAVSAAMAEELAGVVHGGRERVRVVHNGVNLDDLLSLEAGNPTGRPPSGGRPVVLTLARLDWQKGLEHLLRAVPSVPDARFLIAGEGSERHQLEELATALRIADRVEFLGHRTDVAALLQMADVFVLPSVMEGLPVSVVEAMASGTPVVATDIPGTREIVLHEKTGLLAPPGDPVALGAAISRMLRDESLRHRLREAGRALAAAEYSATMMVRRVESIYEDILGQEVKS